MDEWIDVLDESGAKTGETALKSEAHRLGLYHRCFHCWVFGGRRPYLLAQRRSMGKDTWPGWLDVSVAGHLGAGEEALDGRRELEEEIGLRVRPERLIPLGERFVELRIPEGLDREFHDVFLLEDSTPPERLRLQREEVESVVEIPLPGAKAMAKGETVRATEYRDGRSTQVRVSLSDFVPTGDGYIRKVVEAVEEVLAGEEPGEVF